MPRTRRLPAVLAALLCALGLSACGSAPSAERRVVTTVSGLPPAASLGPQLGITEDDADVLWSPRGPYTAAGAPFLGAREQLTALHPAYLRLYVNWARLQPDPRSPPDLEEAVSGCARTVAPCGAYGGVAAELGAIASQQRALGAGSFQVVMDVYGVPAWAALPAHGCERQGTTAVARPLRAQALSAYRALIGDLVALGEKEGVPLDWWTPWNEPNNPQFLSPQRAACSADAPALAPTVYVQLARAMASELNSLGGSRRMLLGELGGYAAGSPHRTSVAEFVQALPEDVLCLGAAWSVHAYAARAPVRVPQDPVALLERALDARGGCAAHAPIWVTEAGAGAPEPGRPREGGPGEEAAACGALGVQLLRWWADPRVKAVLQYTFRDDPDYPVGLSSADLSHVFRTYRLWQRLAASGAKGLSTAGVEQACS